MTTSPPARPGGFALVVLILIAVLSLASGLLTMIVGTTVMHQILSAVQFLIFTVAIAGIGIISAAAPRSTS